MNFSVKHFFEMFKLTEVSENYNVDLKTHFLYRMMVSVLD